MPKDIGFNLNDLIFWVEQLKLIQSPTGVAPGIVFVYDTHPDACSGRATRIIDVQYSLGRNEVSIVLGE